MVAPVSPISLINLPPVSPVRAPARVQRDSGDATGRGLETPQDIVSISDSGSGAADGTSGGPAILPTLPQSQAQQGQIPSSPFRGGQSGTAGSDGSSSANDPSAAEGGTGKASDTAKPGDQTGPDGKKLSEDQKAEIQKLQQTDREVRQHEAAHASAGGGLAGAPSFEYETGPDGRQYAIGGEVPIKVPSVSRGNPQGTISQLEQVVRAALAPADPSGQDRAVAAQAQAEIAQEQALATQQATQKQQAALGTSGSTDGGDGDTTDGSDSSNAANTGDGATGAATASPATSGDAADRTAIGQGSTARRHGAFAAFQAASAISAAAAGQVVDVQA